MNKPRLTQEKDADDAYVFEDVDDTDVVEEHHENLTEKAAMSRIHMKPNNSPRPIQPNTSTFQVNMGPAVQTPMPQQHVAPIVMAPPPAANSFTLLDGTYPEMLYHEMVQAAGSSIQKLKSVATKAFDDNMQNSPAFHQATRHLYNQVFQQLDLYFRNQFAMQYEKGIRDGIDRSICDGVHQDQVSVLERNFERFTQYVNNIMQIHFKLTEEQWEAGRHRRAEEDRLRRIEEDRLRRIEEEARRAEEERIQKQIAQQAEYARQFQKKQYKKALHEQQIRFQQQHVVQQQRQAQSPNVSQAQLHTSNVPTQQAGSLTPQQILVEQMVVPLAQQLDTQERRRLETQKLYEAQEQANLLRRMHLLTEQKSEAQKLEAQKKEEKRQQMERLNKQQAEIQRREAQQLEAHMQAQREQEAIRQRREEESKAHAIRQRLVGREEELKAEARLHEEVLKEKKRQEALAQEEMDQRMKRLQELREEDERRKADERRKEEDRRKFVDHRKEEARRKEVERLKKEASLREETSRLAQQQRQAQSTGPTSVASSSTSKPVDTMTKELIELHMKFLSENQDILTPEEVMKNFQVLTTQMQEAKKSAELAEEKRKADTANAILLQEQEKLAKESQRLHGEASQLIDLTFESNVTQPDSAFFDNAKVPEPSSPAKLSYPSSS